MNREKIISFFKNLPGSLFGEIATNTRLNQLDSLKTLFTSADASNFDLLYIAHSGDKYISKLGILSYDEDFMQPGDRSKDIADLIILKFGSNWDKLYYALLQDYDPISNYDRTEHEEMNSKIKNNTSVKRYGFNTASDSPVGDNDMESETSGLKDDNYRDSHTYGNIGVTSTQQLLESEFELRKRNLLDVIFNDIDTMLCLKIY